MEFFETDQFIVFAYSFVLGLALGFLYDLFKIKRMMFPASNLVLFVDDVLYTLFVSVILILFVFKANSGNIRWYILLCPLFSLCLYRLTISKPVIAFCNFVIQTVKRILRFIIRILRAPTLWILNIILKIFKYLLSKMMKFMKMLKKLFSYKIYWCRIKKESSKGFHLLNQRK